MSEVILTVGLCAYAEADNLRVLLPRVKHAAQALTASYEIVVVEAETPMDETGAVCEALGVHCVRRRGGESYGDAVRTLIAEARGQFLINLDADGSHDAEDLHRLWDVREAFDIVIGSRYVAGAISSNPLLLRCMSWMLNAAFRKATRLPIRDFSNSYRLYRTAVIRHLPLRALDFNILQELLLQALRTHPDTRVGEVAINFAPRAQGVSKRRTVRFLWSYLKLLWATRR